jgi:hypothetical protein
LQHQAGKRFADYLDQGLIPLVLHLADRDPNGVDMTRDNRERLALYTGNEVEVRRLALTMEQVRQYNPPASFAKEKDKRYAGYVRQFRTRKCWELDSFSPGVIAELIRDELEELIDEDKWHAAERQELSRRTKLKRVADCCDQEEDDE